MHAARPPRPAATRSTPTAPALGAAFARAAETQYDVVLSSGFLAFANHSGFLQAVEEVCARASGHPTCAPNLRGDACARGTSRPLALARERSQHRGPLPPGRQATTRRRPARRCPAGHPGTLTVQHGSRIATPRRAAPRPQAGIHVSGVMGTSAGAMAGSLYAAGYTPLEVRGARARA